MKPDIESMLDQIDWSSTTEKERTMILSLMIARERQSILLIESNAIYRSKMLSLVVSMLLVLVLFFMKISIESILISLLAYYLISTFLSKLIEIGAAYNYEIACQSIIDYASKFKTRAGPINR